MRAARQGRAGIARRALAAAALTVLLAACATPTPTPAKPAAEAFRDRAAAALRQLSSVHFTVSHEVGGSDLGGGLILTSAAGDAAFPLPDGTTGGVTDGPREDRAWIAAAVTLPEFGLALDMTIVQIGEQTHMRDPISRVWRIVDQGTLPFDFSGMNDSVADALAEATDLALEEGGERDGVPTYLLTGLVRPEAFRGLVPGAIEGEPLRVQGLIGRDDGLSRSVRLAGRLIEADPPEMVRTLEFTGFDEAVNIEPPV